MNHIRNELYSRLKDYGVKPTDHLLVHTSAKEFLRETGQSPGEVLEAFVGMVSEGALLIPTFNWDWSNERDALRRRFVLSGTPSQMGVVTESARVDHRFVRSHHPVYSFAITGPEAARYSPELHVDAYGENSPFTTLVENDGWVLQMNLPWTLGMTLFHHVEEINRHLTSGYRYRKEFRGSWSETGISAVQESSYYINVRRLENGVTTAVEWVEPLAVVEGWTDEFHVGSTKFTLTRVREFFDQVTGHLERDPKCLHVISFEKD